MVILGVINPKRKIGSMAIHAKFPEKTISPTNFENQLGLRLVFEAQRRR